MQLRQYSKVFPKLFSTETTKIRVVTNRYFRDPVGRLNSLVGMTIDEEEGIMVGAGNLKCQRYGGCRELEEYSNVLRGTGRRLGQKA